MSNSAHSVKLASGEVARIGSEVILDDQTPAIVEGFEDGYVILVGMESGDLITLRPSKIQGLW